MEGQACQWPVRYPKAESDRWGSRLQTHTALPPMLSFSHQPSTMGPLSQC
jgi:hypothetical protein